jgi:probable blue pigment (indigoidine) exporter
MATGVVLSKRWVSPAPLLATTGWQLVAGGLLLLPVAWLVEGALPSSFTAANLAGYSYLALFGSAVAYALWFRGLRALSPTNVTFLGLLSPVVATTLGWLVVDQHLAPLQLAGGLIVLAALITAQLKGTPHANHHLRSHRSSRHPSSTGSPLPGSPSNSSRQEHETVGDAAA